MFTWMAAAMLLQPAPAQEIRYRSFDIATARKKGCRVDEITVPAGKAPQPALIRCPALVEQAQAKGDERPGS